MEARITDEDRSAVLRECVSRIPGSELRTALATMSVSSQVPPVAVRALNALRKHRHPESVVTKAQYRVALPYVAAIVSEGCLEATIDALGDHAQDPDRDQLLAALDEVGTRFSEPIVAVMLASASDSEMPAADLCFRILTTDERYELGKAEEVSSTSAPAEGRDGVATFDEPDGGGTVGSSPHDPGSHDDTGAGSPRHPDQRVSGLDAATDGPDRATTEAKRKARKRRRHEAAETRRRTEETSRRAIEGVRREKKRRR